MRVFTRGAAGGNHLGVVTDPAGLDDGAMQAIAEQLGFSETVFVEHSTESAPFVRIFTPAEELPFAGHPLVGTAWVLMVDGAAEVDRLRFRAGEATIRAEGDLTWVEVEMNGEVAAPGDASDFLARAGVSSVERVGRVMLPREYVVAELPNESSVEALSVDMEVLAERFGTLVFARSGSTVRARFFAPASAVPEDPATGSAAVALASLLAARGEREGRLTIEQGEEIGHPSRIELAWSAGRAAIGGTVVMDEVVRV